MSIERRYRFWVPVDEIEGGVHRRLRCYEKECVRGGAMPYGNDDVSEMVEVAARSAIGTRTAGP